VEEVLLPLRYWQLAVGQMTYWEAFGSVEANMEAEVVAML
jgi:hypothetical protein